MLQSEAIISKRCYYRGLTGISCTANCLLPYSHLAYPGEEHVMRRPINFLLNAARGIFLADSDLPPPACPVHAQGTAAMSTDEFKRRKRELVDFFSDLVKIKIVALFDDRGYALTEKSLQEATKAVMLTVIRQVSVEGDPWCAVKASGQVDKITEQYVNQLARKFRRRP